GVLRWLGETSRDARELLRGPDEDAEERDEITTVIRSYLIECGGSAPAAEVLKATRAAGLVDNAVKKARKRAGVRTERHGYGKGGSWVWTIGAGIGANDSVAPHQES
ncbi:AAA family ATPase, partial [Rhodococcus sp. NPDC003383]